MLDVAAVLDPPLAILIVNSDESLPAYSIKYGVILQVNPLTFNIPSLFQCFPV